MEERRPFNIILASNASTDIFPNNCLTSFTNYFPSDIVVPKGYKIALQSISLDTNLTNLPHSLIVEKAHILIWTQKQYGTIVIVKDPTTQEEKFEKKYTSADERKQNPLEPQLTITIPVNFYTADQLRDFLSITIHKQILAFALYYGIKITVSGDNNIFKINGENCDIYILKELFTFMNFLPTDAEECSYKNKEYFKLKGRIDFQSAITSIKPFISKKRIPRCIKIQVEELKQILNGKNYTKDLAILNLKKSDFDNNDFIHQDINRKEYFSLINDTIRRITINLVDENNYPLALVDGQPTFIQLKLQKMSSQTFILRLRSNDSNDILATNTSSNFGIQLPQPLEFHNEIWTVALTSITYPAALKLNKLMDSSHFWIKRKRSNKLFFFEDDITDSTTFLAALNKKIVQLFGPDGSGQIVIDAASQIAIFVVSRAAQVTFEFSKGVADLLGYTHMPNDNDFLSFNLNGPAKKTFVGKFDLTKLNPHSLFLCCDFTSPVIVGEKYVKLVKMFPCHMTDKTEYVTYNCSNLDFATICNPILSTINFQIKDTSGNDVPFLNQDQYVSITLLFQQVTK